MRIGWSSHRLSQETTVGTNERSFAVRLTIADVWACRGTAPWLERHARETPRLILDAISLCIIAINFQKIKEWENKHDNFRFVW
jgi:hypothetical protein